MYTCNYVFYLFYWKCNQRNFYLLLLYILDLVLYLFRWLYFQSSFSVAFCFLDFFHNVMAFLPRVSYSFTIKKSEFISTSPFRDIIDKINELVSTLYVPYFILCVTSTCILSYNLWILSRGKSLRFSSFVTTFLFDDVNRHTVININKSRENVNGTVAWPSL